jgi:hypothetical protein
MHWKLVATFRDHGGSRGHRIFQAVGLTDYGQGQLKQAGYPHGFAIADNSGGTPELTDDGVLWLDESKPIKVDATHVTFPLVDGRGATSITCDVTTPHAVELLSGFRAAFGLKVEVDPTLLALAQAVRVLSMGSVTVKPIARFAPSETDEEVPF